MTERMCEKIQKARLWNVINVVVTRFRDGRSLNWSSASSVCWSQHVFRLSSQHVFRLSSQYVFRLSSVTCQFLCPSSTSSLHCRWSTHEHVSGLLHESSPTCPWSFSPGGSSCWDQKLLWWPLRSFYLFGFYLFRFTSLKVNTLRVCLRTGASDWWLKQTQPATLRKRHWYCCCCCCEHLLKCSVSLEWKRLLSSRTCWPGVFLPFSEVSVEEEQPSLTLIYSCADIHSHWSSGCTAAVVMTTKRLISGGQRERVLTHKHGINTCMPECVYWCMRVHFTRL